MPLYNTIPVFCTGYSENRGSSKKGIRFHAINQKCVINFFLWDFVSEKRQVYSKENMNCAELRKNIGQASSMLKNLNMLHLCTSLLKSPCQVCLRQQGRYFEQFMNS